MVTVSASPAVATQMWTFPRVWSLPIRRWVLIWISMVYNLNVAVLVWKIFPSLTISDPLQLWKLFTRWGFHRKSKFLKINQICPLFPDLNNFLLHLKVHSCMTPKSNARMHFCTLLLRISCWHLCHLWTHKNMLNNKKNRSVTYHDLFGTLYLSVWDLHFIK